MVGPEGPVDLLHVGGEGGGGGGGCGEGLGADSGERSEE